MHITCIVRQIVKSILDWSDKSYRMFRAFERVIPTVSTGRQCNSFLTKLRIYDRPRDPVTTCLFDGRKELYDCRIVKYRRLFLSWETDSFTCVVSLQEGFFVWWPIDKRLLVVHERFGKTRAMARILMIWGTRNAKNAEVDTDQRIYWRCAKCAILRENKAKSEINMLLNNHN